MCNVTLSAVTITKQVALHWLKRYISHITQCKVRVFSRSWKTGITRRPDGHPAAASAIGDAPGGLPAVVRVVVGT